MLPVNLLNALKEYTLAQKTPLPAVAADTVAKTGFQFDLGQKVQGTVQTQIASNLFKVNVSGQLVQMELPSSIRSGDTVALQVIALQPRLTFSMVNSAYPLSTPEELGATAKMLSSLSQQAPGKAYVRAAQSTPLWVSPQPPESTQLAGMLKEALSNSGLFYESHQVQWLGGTRSTDQLMHEPQNLSPEQARAVTAANTAIETLKFQNATGNATMGTDTVAKAVVGENTSSKVGDDTANKAALPGDAANKTEVQSNITSKAAMAWDAASKTATANDSVNSAVITGNPADANASKQLNNSSQPGNQTPGIPEHLQPLVQQQLNALETRQMMWQGNVWPGQDMQWEVHEQVPQNPAMEGQRQWVTQIQLDLPNLGVVAATLRLNSAGLSLKLNAGTAQTRAVLGGASSGLVSALADAGIPVVSAQVSNES